MVSMRSTRLNWSRQQLIRAVRHGLADQLLLSNSTALYYEKVLAHDTKARDFYRYFEAPGAAHYFGGHGACKSLNYLGSLGAAFA